VRRSAKCFAHMALDYPSPVSGRKCTRVQARFTLFSSTRVTGDANELVRIARRLKPFRGSLPRRLFLFSKPRAPTPVPYNDPDGPTRALTRCERPAPPKGHNGSDWRDAALPTPFGTDKSCAATIRHFWRTAATHTRNKNNNIVQRGNSDRGLQAGTLSSPHAACCAALRGGRRPAAAAGWPQWLHRCARQAGPRRGQVPGHDAAEAASNTPLPHSAGSSDCARLDERGPRARHLRAAQQKVAAAARLPAPAPPRRRTSASTSATSYSCRAPMSCEYGARRCRSSRRPVWWRAVWRSRTPRCCRIAAVPCAQAHHVHALERARLGGSRACVSAVCE
jgi:hypothetical protein